LAAADGWRLAAFGDEVAESLEEQAEVLRSRQVRFVELRAAWGRNVVELGAADLERAATVLATAGLGVSAIASPIGKVPVDGDFEAELIRFRRALDAAQRLGTDRIRIFSFYVPVPAEAHRDRVLRRMSVLADEAAARGLTLVHENECYIYGDTPERCLDLVESVGSPALRLAFDPANFVQVGVAPYRQAWPLLSRYVVHLHVKDAVAPDRNGLDPYPAPVPAERLMDSVRPAGEGEGELRELLAALDPGAVRFLVIEPHLQRRLPGLDGAARFDVALAALRGVLGTVRAGS
jgi:sugar phosphate isomerase/epimerase